MRSDRSERLRLFVIVFLCGACLMALEMAGARLVEPFFGSTIYVWGAIIGLFMGALSIGYFVGGRVADRRPRLAVLGWLALAAGLLTFAAPPLAAPLANALNHWTTPGGEAVLDIKFRSLAASTALFALPSILMGMVSPFAIRLAARRLADVGGVAGTLYAVSTLGSIAGTFAVSFVLVEFLGTKAIVWGVGALLCLVGLYCVVAGRAGDASVGGAGLGPDEAKAARRTAAAAAALVLAGLGFGWAGAREPFVPAVLIGYARASSPSAKDTAAARSDVARKVLEVRESPYHHITILEGDGLMDRTQPARYMMFNDQIESGIVLDAPGAAPARPSMTACGYVEMLHLGMLFTGKPPARPLVIGCGGGLFPLMLRDHYPGRVERIDVVDVDPWVFRMAEKYFGLPAPGTDPVIRTHVDDGRLFVETRPDERWDYIVMDAYSSGGRIPKHLVSTEFFRSVRTRLAPGGLLLANIISRFGDSSAAGGSGGRLYRSVYKTLADAFEAGKPGGAALYVFPRNRMSKHPENIIIVAAMPELEPLDSTGVRRSFERLRGEMFAHLNLAPYVDHYLTLPPAVDDVPLLTDDFCPTDRMATQ